MSEKETKTAPLKVETDTDDVFVLMLLPQAPAFGVEKPLEIEICGRSILKWTENSISALPSKQIEVFKSDDIMSIVRNNAEDYKYTAVIYADTPLLTQNTVEQAISYIRTFKHTACKLPRGWIFETEFIKTTEKVDAVDVPNLPPEDFIVAYNYSQTALISTIQRGRIVAKHLSGGVNIKDPSSAFIESDVKISKGVVIEPNVYLKGTTEIKKNAQILSGSNITDSYIGDGAIINNSTIHQSEVGADTTIGPYANLRANSKIGKGCKIKNFVEIKNSEIGDRTKIAHMTYVGDAEIGDDCNIGCGVVFCNYDGKEKNKCIIGNKVFIGSNTNLVAPLTVGKNAYIAAGSTITQDVPKNALGIARARQAIKEDWTLNKEESQQT